MCLLQSSRLRRPEGPSAPDLLNRSAQLGSRCFRLRYFGPGRRGPLGHSPRVLCDEVASSPSRANSGSTSSRRPGRFMRVATLLVINSRLGSFGFSWIPLSAWRSVSSRRRFASGSKFPLLFADDVKSVSPPSSLDTLLRDLQITHAWSTRWDLPLNASKCGHVSVGNDLPDPLPLYPDYPFNEGSRRCG